MIIQKKPTLRRCVGCKNMIDHTQLIRIAYDADGNFALNRPEEKRKSPGRGAYICQSEDCLAKAQKSKGFERSFKRSVPAEIYEQLRSMYKM